MTIEERDRFIRERAAAGDDYREIVSALAERGVKFSIAKMRSMLELEAQDRRKAAESVAAAQAVSGTELVIASLTELVRQGQRIAARLEGATAVTDEETGEVYVDSKSARAWAEVARSAVAASHALHGIVSGTKPIETLTPEELQRRVRAVYGTVGAADVVVPVEPSTVH